MHVHVYVCLSARERREMRFRKWAKKNAHAYDFSASHQPPSTATAAQPAATADASVDQTHPLPRKHIAHDAQMSPVKTHVIVVVVAPHYKCLSKCCRRHSHISSNSSSRCRRCHRHSSFTKCLMTQHLLDRTRPGDTPAFIPAVCV